MTWDEAMARADGTYYESQIREAASHYKGGHPAAFACDVEVEGFDRWLKGI